MKKVIVVIPRHHSESSADLYLEARGEIPGEVYEHIELDAFKTVYKRREVLDKLKDGWSLIETTDEVMLYILRVKRMHKEIEELWILSNEGWDEIDDDGRHCGTISEVEYIIDNALNELLWTRMEREGKLSKFTAK